MEAIRQWAMGLCGAAAICGLAGCVLPKKSAAKTVLALLMLCAMVSPLTNGSDFSAHLPLEQQEEISAELQEKNNLLAYSIAEDHILKLTRETLKQNGYPVGELEVQLKEMEDQIRISVKLNLPESAQSRENELRNLLRNSCGVEEAEINWQEEQ